MDSHASVGDAVRPDSDGCAEETINRGTSLPHKPSRRQFLKLAIMGGFGFALPGKRPSVDVIRPTPSYAYMGNIGTRSVQAILNPQAAASAAQPLTPFVQTLRGVGPGNIPVAVPDGTLTRGVTTIQHYTIDINQYSDTLHPNLPPTILWGYHSRTNLGDGPGVDNSQRHLGGIIIAQRGTPVQLTVQNNLPNSHILPVDTSLMGADGAVNRATVHIHGGKVPWISDGGPFTWFEPAANGKGALGYGESIRDSKTGRNLYKVLNPNLQPGQAEYYLPNDQSARFAWYHDHALGITRLNAYAGMASGFIIRDAFEDRLVRQYGLPDFIERGGRELPIVIQDKLFLADGRLDYPAAYDPSALYAAQAPLPPVSVVPEMFGDIMLANGTVYPRVDLQGARYRLRILNACSARFLNLQLYVAGADGVTPDLTQPGPDFLVIGTEGGFLSKPVLVPSGRGFLATKNLDGSWNMQGSLITGCAERWDVVVNFSGFAGKRLILCNDAPAPFPNGAVNDSARVIMRFDIGAAIAERPLGITPRTQLGLNPASRIDPYLSLPFGPPRQRPSYHKLRQLTLNEVNDQYGRLIQMLGTNQPNVLPWPLDPAFGPTTYAQMYTDPVTEQIKEGKIEIWEIANLTFDTHPMHFHLVNVEILSRRPFNRATYAGTPTYTGPARGPEPHEQGWKDTVQMHPGEVTTVIMKFDLPKTPYKIPLSPRPGGHEVGWPCHILEHEEHDMMRPLVVMP